MSNPELVSFLKRCQAALLPPSSSSNSKDTSVYNDPGAVIVVKENVCENGPDGTAVSVLDEEDSSLTRLVGYRDWWLVEPENMVADRCYL